MSDWIQSNWYELGSLLVQCTALALLAWFGRGILGILAAAHGRGEGGQERSQMAERTAESLSEQEVALPARALPTREERAPQYLRLPVIRFDLVGWLQEPIGGGGGAARWRRVVRWLQAPMGS